MDILIFDMDGVLLDARGYHRALQRTVSLAAEQVLSLPGRKLSQDDIHQFEALGISSEWHSSAMCLAFLEVQLLSGSETPALDLEQLFTILGNQPLLLPARQRCLQTINRICLDRGIDIQEVQGWITDSENISKSPTMNIFQELVLGSEAFQKEYHKPPRFSGSSYLAQYDLPILSAANAARIIRWKEEGKFASAVMTNRPSSGPPGFRGSPEAEIGLDLVQLRGMPCIGYGEIDWLADQTGQDPANLAKPNQIHALAAIFSALGISKEASLRLSNDGFNQEEELGSVLQGTTITVFEDTPAGIYSVKHAGLFLQGAGIDVTIQPVGIAHNPVKIAALESEGASIAADINLALDSLDNS